MRTNRIQPADIPDYIRGMAGLPRLGWLLGRWRLLEAWGRRRRAAWQMRDASNQLLRDIGLSRSELTTITPLRSSHHR